MKWHDFNGKNLFLQPNFTKLQSNFAKLQSVVAQIFADESFLQVIFDIFFLRFLYKFNEKFFFTVQHPRRSLVEVLNTRPIVLRILLLLLLTGKFFFLVFVIEDEF